MNIEPLLNQQVALLQELDELLMAEQSTLLSFPVNGESLSQLADRKHKAFAKLGELDTLRREAQKTQGNTIGRISSANVAVDNHFDRLWHLFISLAKQVNHKNNINGGLIDRQLIHNQKALNILGELAGKPAYGSDGRTQQRSTNVNLSV